MVVVVRCPPISNPFYWNLIVINAGEFVDDDLDLDNDEGGGGRNGRRGRRGGAVGAAAAAAARVAGRRNRDGVVERVAQRVVQMFMDEDDAGSQDYNMPEDTTTDDDTVDDDDDVDDDESGSSGGNSHVSDAAAAAGDDDGWETTDE